MALFRIDDKTPTLDPTAWVAESAQVIGAVSLGVDASIWFGAVLRGDNEVIWVGQGSNVQDNAVLPTCSHGEGTPTAMSGRS